MTIHWDSLLLVFVVALTSAVAVVGLVALALWGVSVRTAVAQGPAPRSRVAATAATGACLVLAAAIVLVGLWVIVAK